MTRPVSSSLEHRRRTTDPGNQVTVERTDSIQLSDKYYRLHFFNFEMAREWATRTVKRYEANGQRIHLVAYRDWPNGPDGREILGHYNSKDT